MSTESPLTLADEPQSTFGAATINVGSLKNGLAWAIWTIPSVR